MEALFALIDVHGVCSLGANDTSLVNVFNPAAAPQLTLIQPSELFLSHLLFPLLLLLLLAYLDLRLLANVC